MLVRRSIAAGAVALCLAPLTACGGGSDVKDTKSDSPSSASPSSSGDHLTKANFAKEVSQAMNDEKSEDVTMDLAGMRGTGDFSYAGKDTAMRMQLSGAQKMTMIVA